MRWSKNAAAALLAGIALSACSTGPPTEANGAQFIADPLGQTNSTNQNNTAISVYNGYPANRPGVNGNSNANSNLKAETTKNNSTGSSTLATKVQAKNSEWIKARPVTRKKKRP